LESGHYGRHDTVDVLDVEALDELLDDLTRCFHRLNDDHLHLRRELRVEDESGCLIDPHVVIVQDGDQELELLDLQIPIDRLRRQLQ
jgi:hypothetical protein